MIEASRTLLPLLALAWPLALAALASLPPVRPHAIRLLLFAPLPALWLGLTEVQGSASFPALLLGVTLAASPAGALLFVMTAALWFGAAVYAQSYMTGTRKPAVFAGFWCLTLAGNLGVFLAADVATFYVAFATVSLAAYVLIVHEATDAALRAGRVYVAMVVLGEVCLLAAFVIGIAAANSLDIAEIRAALASAPLGALAAVLLVAGFGIKAGLMPLHFWLPLAHPAAPTPASAVLSGAIVKAGIIGMMLFLPAGTGFAGWLVALGFVGAFAGALLGLSQSDPKAILAYSTISQMSLVTALIGSAAANGAGYEQIAFYALHHGLAKGALFLSVGLVAACAGGWRAAKLAAVALVALSVAGAPLTGGSLAKLAAKSELAGMADTLLTLTAITTTLVLASFLIRLGDAKPGRGRPPLLLAIPTLALGLAALIVPWLLGPGWSGLEPGYAVRWSSLWSSAWPVAAGLAAALVWSRRPNTEPASTGRRTASRVQLWRDAVIHDVQSMATAAQVRGERPEKTAKRAWADLRAAIGVANGLERRLQRGENATFFLIVLCGTIALSQWLW
ncbi:NADH/ubiquinone/plastoquinone (complex I) [Aurantimonas aggregata]|uniref:NADH/ubiquinone/plastoquinone (Complex I) n=1 Tax=Aurantimonas aggregata TaxID=2047720 RepID=A0A6L9MP61_9HYPH|nr:complex I subunit 5 family protein [Aurantimonas aggregata]NDV89482.1 NADH/ubiquinone/plastoquinone (complex I) [Aurantimonas aggregata]